MGCQHALLNTTVICLYDSSMGNETLVKPRILWSVSLAIDQDYTRNIKSRKIYWSVQSKYSSLAAKRFKQFKRQKHEESIKNGITSFMIKVFELVVRALLYARIIRKQQVETVRVESD